MYPQTIREIYAAVKWIVANGKEIGIDGARLAIVGNSAGGNMSAATVLTAAEKKTPAIKVQVLMWPASDASFSQHSYY